MPPPIRRSPQLTRLERMQHRLGQATRVWAVAKQHAARPFYEPLTLLARAADWRSDGHPISRFAQQAIYRLVVPWYIEKYGVDLTQAAKSDFSSFNEFFARALKDGARPIDPDPNIVLSPADGKLSHFGVIQGGRLMNADGSESSIKGQHFTVDQLLAGSKAESALFEGGLHFTIYLSPKDYHRFHSPTDAKVTEMRRAPGTLFSVGDHSMGLVGGLLARNERVIAMLDHYEHRFAYVAVGACIVRSVRMRWHENGERRVGRPSWKEPQLWGKPSYWLYRENERFALKRGDEVGSFALGSTVVVLTPPGMMEFLPGLEAGPIQMGASIGRLLKSA